jgi:predicted small lipoprotein YifL
LSTDLRLTRTPTPNPSPRGGGELTERVAPFCVHFTGTRLARIATIGALVAALGLAGCGRKGGLDPPPGAAASDQAAAAQPGAVPEPGPDGQPMAPGQPPRRRTPIDFLID